MESKTKMSPRAQELWEQMEAKRRDIEKGLSECREMLKGTRYENWTSKR